MAGLLMYRRYIRKQSQPVEKSIGASAMECDIALYYKVVMQLIELGNLPEAVHKVVRYRVPAPNAAG
jgi:hypothetical protein